MAGSHAVARPSVTFDIIRSGRRAGLDGLRTLITAQITASANIPAGVLVSDIPQSDLATIRAMVGADSHAYMVLSEYRRHNEYTAVDFMPFANAQGATAATFALQWAGTATSNNSLYVTCADKRHRNKVDVSSGEGPAEIIAKLTAAVNDDRWMPFTQADDGTNKNVFTANNAGSHANDWPFYVEGFVPGITYTITVTPGSGDPSLTGIFDQMQSTRYTNIVWPSTWDLIKPKDFLDARKNLDNVVMDGFCHSYRNLPLAGVKALRASLNSDSIIIHTNEPTSEDDWKGPHIPKAPDALTAEFVAKMDLREEDGVSISHIIADNNPLDQFGGLHTITKPFFNTPIDAPLPRAGTGYSEAEIVELVSSGVSVMGANRSFTGLVMGEVVTTNTHDLAGNEDDTWLYLNWALTHRRIREYFVNNYRKAFPQHRLSHGAAIEGYAIATVGNLKSFGLKLFNDLAAIAVCEQGEDAQKYFLTHSSWEINMAARRAIINLVVPIVSKLASINGTIKTTFEVSTVNFELDTAK